MHTISRCVSIAMFALLLAGCASSHSPSRSDADPLESYNRAMFAFNEAADRAVIKPVAQAYQTVLPDPVIASVGHFFSNLNDVVVLAHDLLQFKLHQAAIASGRIVFNTTFGLLGLFDVASRMELPKHYEDLGQTLAVWGVGEGPYLVLPLLGPSTLRDSFGLVGDSFIDPLTWGTDSEAAQWSLRGLDIINRRAGLLRVERAFAGAEIDPYEFRRSAYLQQRRSLVRDGEPLKPDFDSGDADPAETAP
ncbi:MAG: VacJ family lipoprotein [Candidatus Competibacteraceae bacterium]|nr:VacJ family lipoprotein [Candidatus Competibacteraceae bacterium]